MLNRVPDRTVRSLGALQKTASTSRVLNLVAVERGHGAESEYESAPFFKNKVLNSSVVLKHRLRADEREFFDDGRQTATKVIIPFERTDLRLGGRSIFVEQRGWEEVVVEVCGMAQETSRDLSLLTALDELPSLDPFLLREHLKRRGFEIARCYFALTESDQQHMQSFVSAEISKLIRLAYANGESGENQTAKLVELLLSAENDDRLEPLRMTLQLEGESYREGIFCWRGFLYYKWVLSSLWPQLKQVIEELPKLKVTGPRDAELMTYLDGGRARLHQKIEAQRRSVALTLKVYDDAFRELTVNQRPLAFRDFLLKAPSMFLTLGDRIGVVSHMASFWRYRFPRGRPLVVDLHEAVDMLQEFEASVAGAEAA